MVAIKIPSPVRLVTDRLKSLPVDVSYKNMISIVALFLLNRASLSDCVRTVGFSASVSSLANGVKKFPPGRLLRRTTKKILKRILETGDYSRFVFVLDDTANPKYGGNIYAVSYWGGAKNIYFGQRILCLAIVDLKTKKSYPIDYVITDKSEDMTMLDHSEALIRNALEQGFPNLTVVTDSWFSSVDLISKLLRLGCQYVGEIKKNRRVKRSPNPHCRWKNITSVFAKQKRKRIVTQWDRECIRTRKRKGKVIAKCLLRLRNCKNTFNVIAVYNRRNSKGAFAYYLATDISISRARIWLLSRARWSIECIFRTCKQNLSFGKLSCKSKNASNLAVEMPFYLYASIALEPSDFGGSEDDSIDLILSKIRDACTEDTLTLAIGGQKVAQLKSLRVRLDRTRSSRKPVVSIAASC